MFLFPKSRAHTEYITEKTKAKEFRATVPLSRSWISRPVGFVWQYIPVRPRNLMQVTFYYLLTLSVWAKSVEYICKVCGIYLQSLWNISAKSVEYICKVCGTYMQSLWNICKVCGIYLQSLWNISAKSVERYGEGVIRVFTFGFKIEQGS